MTYNRMGLSNNLRANFAPLGTHADANIKDFIDMCEHSYISHHDFNWLRQEIHQYLVNRGIINDIDFSNRVAGVVYDYLINNI